MYFHYKTHISYVSYRIDSLEKTQLQLEHPTYVSYRIDSLEN